MKKNKADNNKGLKSLSEDQIQVTRQKSNDARSKEEPLSKVVDSDELAKRDLDVAGY